MTSMTFPSTFLSFKAAKARLAYRKKKKKQKNYP
jgi:hypothetical protein